MLTLQEALMSDLISTLQPPNMSTTQQVQPFSSQSCWWSLGTLSSEKSPGPRCVYEVYVGLVQTKEEKGDERLLFDIATTKDCSLLEL